MSGHRNHEGYPDPTAWEAINSTTEKSYKRQIIGARSRIAGEIFERQIEGSLHWHFDRGLLKSTKTPEPMKPIRPMGKGGQFLAHYEKKAQVDFCGTMHGGRSVRFEAKQTDSEKFERSRLTEEQMNDLRDNQKLGALCFVLLCFGLDHFYRVPWQAWENMKELYGRKYVTEVDVQQFRIPYTSGVIKILHGILDVNDLPESAQLPDLCVSCGEYAEADRHECPAQQKKGATENA